MVTANDGQLHRSRTWLKAPSIGHQATSNMALTTSLLPSAAESALSATATLGGGAPASLASMALTAPGTLPSFSAAGAAASVCCAAASFAALANAW